MNHKKTTAVFFFMRMTLHFWCLTKVKLLESILSTELTNISKWFRDNKLSLHLAKTEAIIFGSRPKLCRSSEIRVGLGGEVLTTKTSVSYLGCILDGSLGGVSMANKVLGLMPGLRFCQKVQAA
jgi:hypothetical protein